MGKESRKKAGQPPRAVPASKGSQDAPSPVVDRRALEKTMSDLRRLLAEQDFADIDEANRFIANLMTTTGGRIPAGRARTPLQEAQDLMYEAWDAKGAARVRLARRALEVSPDCADAYVLLAEESARNVEEARDLFAQGVAAGERGLGPEFFEEETGHFWGILETRPYMRAREGLAERLWRLGEREAAIEHYREMLRLNPNDNQGLRYVLLNCLLGMGRDDEAGDLLSQYEDDGSAEWLYNHALWLFRREGGSPNAVRSLKEALAENKHVPAYLLGRKRIPSQLPDTLAFGGEDEAVDYVIHALSNWMSTSGALTWLAAEVPATGKGQRQTG